MDKSFIVSSDNSAAGERVSSKDAQLSQGSARVHHPSNHIARDQAGAPPVTYLTIHEFARLLGMTETVLRERLAEGTRQKIYFAIKELAERWRVSRGTVYNRLRAVGANVLDFGGRGKKSRKVVHIDVVLQIEKRMTKRLC